MIGAGLTGFFTGFSLILAIGAQNAYVLRQGITRNHIFALCLLCAVSDAALIIVGVAGFGALVHSFPNLPLIMSAGGAAFLIVYGVMRFSAALKGSAQLAQGADSTGLMTVLLTGAAFTWLNPHVYLDTLGLVGAVSTSYQDPFTKISFGAGAVLASFVFFFGLGYGARLLQPFMSSRRSWQIFDVAIGLTMWAIAAKLIIPLVDF
jgi:L-lysine exporter family protein LysE/ArgO